MLAIIFALISVEVTAEQPDSITIEQQVSVMTELKKSLAEHYIYLDKAERVGVLLDELIKERKLADISDKRAFTKALTKEIQTILNDKHFRVIIPRPRPIDEDRNVLDTHVEVLTRFRKGGFQDIKILEGNVGYVKIDGFRAEDKHQVDGLMTYLRTVDAIIFDLTNNGGGGQPVNYLTSYFLPENTLIGKTYHRKKDAWTELRSEPVEGDRRPNVPLFIITSDFTFSAAEAFTYNLQARGRATVVGEVTGGGAHPTAFFPVNNNVAVLMPNRRSYNSVTRSNWEAKGIQPEALTTEDEAFDKAHELAKVAAHEYKTERFEELKDLLINDVYTDTVQEKVTETVSDIIYRKHAEPFMIPFFARNFKEKGNITAARFLLTANASLYPDSSEAQFLLAELLKESNRIDSAKIHLAKAIELGQGNQEDLKRYLALEKELQSKSL